MQETRVRVCETSSRRPRSLIGRLLLGSSEFDDVEQQVSLHVAAGANSANHHPIAQPKSVLLRIAKRLALSQLTRKARQITEYIEDSSESKVINEESVAEEALSTREMLGLHCEAVAELAPECRQVYLLRKVHGFSHKDIAAHLGISVSAVGKHLIKAAEGCDRYVRRKTDSRRKRALTGIRGAET